MTKPALNAINAITRRDFLRSNACVLAGTVLAGGMPLAVGAEPTPERRPVRIGVVGTGGRGRGLMSTLLALGGVRIPAVCDTDAGALAAARQIVTRAGQAEPEGYSGPEDYRRLMEREDLEAVIIATPWDLHTRMAVHGMKSKKIVGCEVPIAYTLQECRELMDTHAATGTPCMMLENWSFRPDNLAVLNMIREGLLGRITHAHCAYSHNCINHWYFDSRTGDDRWGARYLVEHNRAQYPTHQQGPVLSWMDINCGDYYDTLTSTATDSFSINEFFRRHFPGHRNAGRKYAQGDIVTTVVRTKRGRSLVINFDMQTPRPYDNRWEVEGTLGVYNEQRNAVSLEGGNRMRQEWEPFPPYQEKYRHPWAMAATGGHGGADGIMLAQFVEAVREGRPLPLSLADGVLMSSIGPLSEASIAGGGKVIHVPDFTGGAWKTNKPYFAVSR